MEFDVDNEDVEVDFNEDYDAIIKKIRKIAKMFRTSPTKMDSLRKILREKYGKEYSIQKDMKVRWNSMLDMLRRFQNVKDGIKETLQEYSQLDLFPSNQELDIVENMVDALEIIEISAVALCNRDFDLLDADVTLNHMLKSLKDDHSDISVKL